LASKSAIESDNSAKEGSNASSGSSEAPLRDALPDSRNEEREDGRRGVVGRESGLRDADVERRLLLPAWGVVEDDMMDRFLSIVESTWRLYKMLLTFESHAT